MADIDINVVAKNLAELLTNTTNIVSEFYNIFFNPSPMIVTLEMYNSDDELITVEIPNRAMDRNIALQGTEDPEGVVEAISGTIYINTLSQKVFIKVSGSGSIGWQEVLTQAKMEEFTYSQLQITQKDTTVLDTAKVFADTRAKEEASAVAVRNYLIATVLPESGIGNVLYLVGTASPYTVSTWDILTNEWVEEGLAVVQNLYNQANQMGYNTEGQMVLEQVSPQLP